MTTWTNRAFLKNLSIGVLFDFAIAAALAQFLDADFWTAFVVTLAVLWVLPIFFRIKTIILKGLLYFINRRSTRQILVQEFRRAELPLLSGTKFNDPADLYFSEVAANDEHPKNARIFAAQTVGQLALVPNYSWADALVFNANLDASLAEYFDQIRRDNAMRQTKIDREAAD